MTASVNPNQRERMSLPARRVALLARIHAARLDSAQIGRRLALDLHATERSRQSIHAGWKLLKASAVAAGVVWSFSATSNFSRGRRFLTIAVSLLSTLRAMRKVRSFLSPLTKFPTLMNRQG